MLGTSYPFRPNGAIPWEHLGRSDRAPLGHRPLPRVVERFRRGLFLPRHQHFESHASIILEAGVFQSGYAGRVRLEPGDVLIQPTLDRHQSTTLASRDGRVLHLPWRFESGPGGVFRVKSVDDVIRTASRDPWQAVALLAEGVRGARAAPALILDWADLLAADLRLAPVRITLWAERHGLARETVARGFQRAFGVSPCAFGSELRARQAWMRVVTTSAPLAGIAVETGFADQAHMTRAIGAFTGLPPHAWRRQLSRLKAAA